MLNALVREGETTGLLCSPGRIAVISTRVSYVSLVLFLLCLKGYQGMVDGGECIQLAEWKTVSGIIQKVSSSVFGVLVEKSTLVHEA